MEHISEIMDPRCIRLSLDARNNEDAVRELVQSLAAAHKLDGVDRYFDAVMDRERLSSTGIGHGIAIPHRLVAGVDEIMVAIGRSEKGVPFNSVDGKPAHLVFLIIGPEGQNQDYLHILSTLSRYLNDRGFFEALMRADTVDEVLALFNEKDLNWNNTY